MSDSVKSRGDPAGSDDLSFQKLAVIGPGLLGGSLAMDTRVRRLATEVAVWGRRPEVLAEVEKRGLAHKVSTNLPQVVSDADLIIICTPVEVMGDLARQMAPHLKPGVIVTDVGSVKARVVKEVGEALPAQAHFVGSHPMAGSEKSGLEAARPKLFQGAITIVTPVEATHPPALGRVKAFWRALGSQVRELHPDEHDRIIALVSHLPHLTASTLVNLVCNLDPNSLNFCGKGFGDTTRIASGSPTLWTGILRANRLAVAEAIDGLITELSKAKTLLDSEPDLEKFLAHAQARRDQMINERT